MSNTLKVTVILLIGLFFGIDPAFAAEEAGSGGSSGLIAIAAGIAVGLAAMGGALGQGRLVSSALDSIGRNPSASGNVFTPMILGMVFVEALVILAWVISYMLIGAL